MATETVGAEVPLATPLQEVTFRSDRQRQRLGLLFDAYWTGSPGCRTSTVLFESGHKDGTSAFTTVFNGRDEGRAFIKQADGNCRIAP